MLRVKRSLPWVVPALLLLAALAWRHFDPGGVSADIQRAVFDRYQRFEPRSYEPAPVRIVDIDDASLAKIGQWPWPRSYVAGMVRQLARAGAAAIAFDIVFPEPDRTSPANILPLWAASGGLTKPLKEALAALPDHDVLLAKAIDDAGTVVTGFALTAETSARLPLGRGTFAWAGDDPRQFVPASYGGAVVNLKEFEQAAAGNGAFNFDPDDDLVVRSIPLVMRVGNQLYAPLAAEALRVAQGAKTYKIKSSGASAETAFGEHTGISSVQIGAYSVPTDSRGRLLMHYSLPDASRYVPAWKILSGDFDRAKIEGQIVLIGTSAAGLLDIKSSPITAAMPGVEAHAQAIEQIVLGHYLQRPDWADGAESAFLLAVGIVLIVTLRHLGALWSAAAGAAAIAAIFAASWYAYRVHLFLFDPVTPSVAAFAVYLCGTIVGYLRTEFEKRAVRGAFKQYLSPALVEQLAEDPSKLKLGGELREMTFLFCDVRGFTSISERYKSQPQDLTKLINRFLTPMTDTILERRGTIDKYMGDCIMAFWNAPLDDTDHADNACAGALAMLEALERLNGALEGEARAAGREFNPLHVGIGVNTGDCVVGNVGSDQRFGYSVLGDAVNLASRLEGQSKTYGVDIVIGEATRAHAPSWATLELDLIAVKGKHEAVRIFTLLGDAEMAQSAGFRALSQRHEAMLSAYRAQQWSRASELIRECRLLDGTVSGLYDLYEERIARFMAEPPGPDWNGVFVALTK
ncbi:MAG TPA: adenylate/guanylate cyclase domain-containing protein [Candidatus Cybelea sp.]|nr:adenylate/guanylate cyclase domain-containing protein [Candidatus Cybelea sp.]